ncbi:MAG: phage holin [Syntrophomonadaceae bacterium]|nr:phage holin [Syntrophomonadaceae bacterium]
MKNTDIKPGTVARLMILILLLVNQALIMLGMPPVEFVEEELYNTLSTFLTVIWSMWAAWKNNSVTSAAIQADEYMKYLKEGGI